jgi:hypothetical protein
LHKVRRAMVNAAREPLYGEVEIDNTWVGGPQAGLRGSRQTTRPSGIDDSPDGLKGFEDLQAAGGKHVRRPVCYRCLVSGHTTPRAAVTRTAISE